MKPLEIIVYFDNNECFDWGWDLNLTQWKITAIGKKNTIDLLKEKCQNPNFKFIETELSSPNCFFHCIELLVNLKNIDQNISDNILFATDRFLYKYVSNYYFYDKMFYNKYIQNLETNCSFSNYVIENDYLFTISSQKIQEYFSFYKNLNRNIIYNLNDDITKPDFKLINKEFEDINIYFANFYNGPKTHIIGDSHVLFTFLKSNEIACKSHIFKKYEGIEQFTLIHHIGSKSCYGFSKDERFNVEYFKSLGIKNGDKMAFVFGEIDIRSYVYKPNIKTENIENQIKELTKKYFEKINYLKENFESQIYVMGAVPPFDGNLYDEANLPKFGTIEQRIIATKLFNKMCLNLCLENGFKYFEINEFYEKENGEMDIEKSDHFCHISSFENDLAIERMINTLNV